MFSDARGEVTVTTKRSYRRYPKHDGVTRKVKYLEMHLTGSERGVKLDCDRKEIVMEGKKRVEKDWRSTCYKHKSKFEISTINGKAHKTCILRTIYRSS